MVQNCRLTQELQLLWRCEMLILKRKQVYLSCHPCERLLDFFPLLVGQRMHNIAAYYEREVLNHLVFTASEDPRQQQLLLIMRLLSSRWWIFVWKICLFYYSKVATKNMGFKIQSKSKLISRPLTLICLNCAKYNKMMTWWQPGKMPERAKKITLKNLVAL